MWLFLQSGIIIHLYEAIWWSLHCGIFLVENSIALKGRELFKASSACTSVSNLYLSRNWFLLSKLWNLLTQTCSKYPLIALLLPGESKSHFHSDTLSYLFCFYLLIFSLICVAEDYDFYGYFQRTSFSFHWLFSYYWLIFCFIDLHSCFHYFPTSRTFGSICSFFPRLS